MQKEEEVNGHFVLMHVPAVTVHSATIYPSAAMLTEAVFTSSTRNYTVPDPPGLFDGHVWPMYLKHRKEMEANNVDVGM